MSDWFRNDQIKHRGSRVVAFAVWEKRKRGKKKNNNNEKKKKKSFIALTQIHTVWIPSATSKKHITVVVERKHLHQYTQRYKHIHKSLRTGEEREREREESEVMNWNRGRKENTERCSIRGASFLPSDSLRFTVFNIPAMPAFCCCLPFRQAKASGLPAQAQSLQEVRSL